MLPAMFAPPAASMPPPRRPDGWVPPGPGPAANPIPVAPGEELSFLVGNWRILQRKDGHRWSLDDLVTAWLARSVATHLSLDGPFLDLGTGIGSVALITAWAFPNARVTGVEAQDISVGMATRSARFNGCDDRVTFLHADLRSAPGTLIPAHAWPLVTGTPPYFDDPNQPRSTAPQKEPCRFELRGGVEDYLIAFALALAPDGFGVLCHASRQRDRVITAVARANLQLAHLLEVTPKVGRDPLVDVFVVARSPASFPLATTLVVRDAADQWTPAFLALREMMGMPPPRLKPAAP